MKACRVVAVLLPILCPAGEAPQDARSIVKRSVSEDNRDDRLRWNYTYKVFNETRDLDSAGKVKDTHSTREEVLYIGGKQFVHPLERDGKPLSRKEAAREQAKLDSAVAEASRLSDDEKKRRIDKELESRAKRREQIQYIPDAFDFRIVGDPVLNGRPAWQIRASPRPDYRGPHASLLHNMEGTIWIDKQDYRWVRVEADTLDTISFGFFLARIGKGTRISFENFKLNGEVWAPKHIQVKASARFGLVKKVNEEQELTFSDYRKFQTDSRILPTEEVK